MYVCMFLQVGIYIEGLLLWRPEEGIRFLKLELQAVVTQFWSETELSPLEECYMLLTTEPSH